jgi:hypothetical protein
VPLAAHLPHTPGGQRIAGATIAVTGRRTRKVTRAELRGRKVILRGLPVGTTARVVITIHRHTASGRRSTAVVRRTLRVSCPSL